MGTVETVGRTMVAGLALAYGVWASPGAARAPVLYTPAPAPMAAQIRAQLVVTYFEGLPGKVADLHTRLSAYARHLRQNPAHPRVEVLREIGRRNRMALIERWPSGSHAQDSAREALVTEVEPLLQAPADVRLHTELSGSLPGRSAATFRMLMHVDVAPAGAASAAVWLRDQQASILAAPGGVGAELAVQSDKANHFAVYEIWANRQAYEAYAASTASRALRKQLYTVKGALFDDRFFQTEPVFIGKGY